MVCDHAALTTYSVAVVCDEPRLRTLFLWSVMNPDYVQCCWRGWSVSGSWRAVSWRRPVMPVRTADQHRSPTAAWRLGTPRGTPPSGTATRTLITSTRDCDSGNRLHFVTEHNHRLWNALQQTVRSCTSSRTRLKVLIEEQVTAGAGHSLYPECLVFLALGRFYLRGTDKRTRKETQSIFIPVIFSAWHRFA